MNQDKWQIKDIHIGSNDLSFIGIPRTLSRRRFREVLISCLLRKHYLRMINGQVSIHSKQFAPVVVAELLRAIFIRKTGVTKCLYSLPVFIYSKIVY